jgi:hypothetical protein
MSPFSLNTNSSPFHNPANSSILYKEKSVLLISKPQSIILLSTPFPENAIENTILRKLLKFFNISPIFPSLTTCIKLSYFDFGILFSVTSICPLSLSKKSEIQSFSTLSFKLDNSSWIAI